MRSRPTRGDWAEAFDPPEPGRCAELRSKLNNSWTLIEAADLVADLWSVPAYLRKCAP